MERITFEKETSGLSNTTDGIFDRFTIVLPAGELQEKH
jgi:hypothetical protein